MAIKRSKPRRDAQPAPCFASEMTDAGDTRLVAWAPTVRAQAAALSALVLRFPARVELLLTVSPSGDDVPDEEITAESTDAPCDWRRYHGVVSRGALLEALARCEAFVYRDGRSQLCIRDPVTLDYVVFDEHGIFYVYSNAPTFRHALEELGFDERGQVRVGWLDARPGATLQGGEQDPESEFVRLLRLSRVPAPGHSHPAESVH